MRRLTDSFAEYERLIISARTKSALAAKRRRGERVSGLVPFGYSLGADGRTLLAIVEEKGTIETIHLLRAAGTSMAGIADELNRRGLRTRAGSRWRFENVRRVPKRITASAA